ncbi:SDR family NAD(P)-dependent oxidoreductase [Kibdelosporangium aridum]|uniref:SDR family NAD(P)-dependent oxidoreductase n=1 Tax=Kibdelosporangium aridum TaxID=2030 RepID=UPI0035EBA322
MSITPQQPIGTGFSAASTADEVLDGVDLTGRTAIVTGGYSGIGIETVRSLRNAGADVIVPARDKTRAAKAIGDIDGVEFAELDLADPLSIDAFAEAFAASGRALHMLVNSAGIMAVPLHRDDRGYESHFATNHLGHFQLTARLWPALIRVGGARIAVVSSWGHRQSDIVWDDVHFERREYQPMLGYGQSKTANNLFAVELDRRGRSQGVRAFALHPGSIITPLARHTSTEALMKMGVIDENGEPVIDPSRNMKTPQQGAATSVLCAASPLLDGLGGVYCENGDIAPFVEADETTDTARRSASCAKSARSPTVSCRTR